MSTLNEKAYRNMHINVLKKRLETPKPEDDVKALQKVIAEKSVSTGTVARPEKTKVKAKAKPETTEDDEEVEEESGDAKPAKAAKAKKEPKEKKEKVPRVNKKGLVRVTEGAVEGFKVGDKVKIGVSGKNKNIDPGDYEGIITEFHTYPERPAANAAKVKIGEFFAFKVLSKTEKVK